MKNKLYEGLSILREDIINSSIAQGQKASGRTYAAIVPRVLSETHGELLVPKYITVLRDGRQPGKVPYNFEEILKEWAEAKGLYFEDYSALAWSIRRKGTKLFRQGGGVDIFEGPIQKFEKWLVKDFAKQYKIQIVNSLK